MDATSLVLAKSKQFQPPVRRPSCTGRLNTLYAVFNLVLIFRLFKSIESLVFNGTLNLFSYISRVELLVFIVKTRLIGARESGLTAW